METDSLPLHLIAVLLIALFVVLLVWRMIANLECEERDTRLADAMKAAIARHNEKEGGK